jgi:hypothetical protein
MSVLTPASAKSNRLERLVHRIRHGHWPLYTYVPLTTYLEWRVCQRCR